MDALGRPDTEFDLTVEEILTRDRDTDEESTAWDVKSENLDRPHRGDTPAEALRVLADALEADSDEKYSISVDDLAGD